MEDYWKTDRPYDFSIWEGSRNQLLYRHLLLDLAVEQCWNDEYLALHGSRQLLDRLRIFRRLLLLLRRWDRWKVELRRRLCQLLSLVGVGLRRRRWLFVRRFVSGDTQETKDYCPNDCGIATSESPKQNRWWYNCSAREIYIVLWLVRDMRECTVGVTILVWSNVSND